MLTNSWIIIQLLSAAFISPPLLATALQNAEVEKLSIFSMHPSFGDTNGGTPVVMSVGNRQIDSISHCIFGDEVVPAAKNQSTMTIKCTSPPMTRTGSVPVGLTMDGEDFSMSTHSFDYLHPASFLALTPAGGPELGGTKVTISGSNFVQSSELACYFGDIKTKGRFVSSEEIACVTPTTRPGSYDLRLSFNGVDVQDTSFLYGAYLQMTALAAVPAFGVKDGGTEISVYGTNFRWEDNLHCRFGKGSSMVNATVVGSNIVKCLTPKWSVSTSVELAVVSDNGNVAMLDDEFEFYTPFHLSSFQPSSGFLRGGTTVTIHGRHFSRGARGSIRCVFGEMSVESTIGSDSRILCKSPPSNKVGDVQIAISYGSDEFKLNSAMFSYVNEILIDDYPAVVALTNAEKAIAVHGSFFQNTSDLTCSLIPNNILLNADFVSNSRVECRMPEGVYPGEYGLTISNNGQDYSDSVLPLLVIDPFRFHTINPSMQFLDLVSEVTIEGRNFVELIDLTCIIDEEHVTQARFISSTQIECSIPEDIQAGTISVTLALDGEPISIGPPLLLTLVEINITSVHPSFGDTNGGTPVMLQVNDDKVDVISHCIFGDQIVPAVKMESAIQCTAPPMLNVGTVPVGLSVTNGEDFSMSKHSFDFTTPASFSTLTPANGPELGGTIIRIAGSDFANSTDFACYFDDNKATGRFVSNEEVECVSPVLRPGSYDVRLSFNGIDILRTVKKFLSNYAIDVLSIAPSMGSVLGGTDVSIIGKSFVPNELLTCRFGDIEIVPAIFVSSTEISCVSPDASKHLQNATTVDVQVSLNGVDFSPATVQYQFSPPAFVQSIHPAQGSVNGGTQVIVKGENFVPSLYPSCDFGNSSVPATVHSESELSCISPKYTSHEAVPFRITLNGVDEVVGADGTMDFLFLPAIRATSIEPNSGPSVGGTIVTVEGFDFDESLKIRCRFGTSDPVGATVVSGEKIQCKTPSHPFGIVPFVLSSEETDVVSHDALFEFYKPPRIISVYPNSGPNHGNTPVKVHGNFFRSTTEYLCHFGGISVRGEFLTVGSIVCPSPNATNPGDNVVGLTITDREANFTQESLSFSYVQPPTLKSLSPIHVFFEGGDSIAVRGHGFNSTDEVWCRFLSPVANASEFANVIKVRANAVFDDENVLCATPSYPPTDEQVEVLLALSTNGHDWSTNSLSIYYVPNLSISAVHPSLGTVEGGTIVRVIGTGFFEGDDLWCDFGAAGSTTAKLISYSKVSCLTPPTSVPRNVTVSLNFKGSGDYVSSGQSFTYHRQLSLVDAKPLRGFVCGGTAVTITGTGFVDVPSLSCRFGGTVVKAKYISRNMIECRSPPAGEVGKVDLDISLNGVDFAQFMSSEIVFHYDSEIELHAVSPKNVAMKKSIQSVITKAEDRYITLYGKGFVNTTSLSCLFGSKQITAATFITETEVKCSLPESGNSGEIQVRVSLNGVDFCEKVSTILFVPPAVISDVYPSRVQEGSEIDLFISGDNFVQSSALQCYFGSNNYFSKPATWISESSLMCTSPPMNLTYDGFELLWISNNGGHDLSSPFPLGVTARSHFLSIRPNTGYIDGGTRVCITLSNVQYVSNLSCQFGELFVSAELVSANNIACVSPSIHSAGVVTVKVFSDDIHLQAAGSFEYLSPPLLGTLHPKMGLVEGGSVTSISGKNLAGLTHCRFSLDDDTYEVTRAIESNDISVMCQVPSMKRQGKALVQVSHNEQNFVGADLDLLFAYKERPRIFSIVPAYGSDTGGKMVHILGKNFNDGAMIVHFGDVIVRASVISSNLISCVSPTLRIGQTSVSVSVEGIDDLVGNETLPYESIQLPQIGAIHPRVGIVGGNTQVIVNTTKLFKSDRLSCHFGDLTVMAVSTSLNSVSCLAPATHDGGIVDLSISVDGERRLDAGGKHTQFTFVPEPRVLSMSPNIGWTTGGDRIVFAVENMAPFSSSAISCLFGGSSDHVNAMIDIESNAIFCDAPVFDRYAMVARAPVNLIVDDGVNKILLTAGKYNYLEPAIVTKIDPSVGTIRGGTVVKATGINFEGMRGLSLSCLFGNVAVDAEIGNEGEIICISPEWSGGPKKTIVSIGIGNNTEMVLKSQSSFEYLAHPSIAKILPRFGHPSGGTAVVITGHALSWPGVSKHLSCRFGDAALVPAKAVKNNDLLCVAPPLTTKVSMHEGSFDTNLTLYANHGKIPLASSDELYIYTNGVTLKSLSTNSGPYTGGTDISIAIIGFRGLPTDKITCIFDEIESIGVYSIVENEEFVICTTPAMKGAKPSHTVLLRLGIDKSDVISNGELFTFYSPPTVSSVFPSYGFLEGGEEVLVTGTKFRNTTSLNCYFGDKPSAKIEWISDSSILCTSPLIENNEASSRVNVTVTNNGIDFTRASTLTEYEYTHRPDASSMWPTLMNEVNRTSVVIKGKGLSRVKACLFGNVKHRYQAFNVTDNIIHCDVPPDIFEGPPEFISIFLALDNGVFGTDLNIRYEAPPVIPDTIPEPIIAAAEPTSGASAGGGWIRVAGEGFLSRTELACKFGEIVSHEVQYLSSEEVLCKIPRHLPGKVTFSVTNGGQEEGKSKLFEFTFLSDVSIKSIFPSSGSVEGGTKTRIYGSFSSLNPARVQPKCKFGTAGVVEGVLVSQNEIYCVSPPATMVETVELRLSIDNGYNFILSSSWFTYTLASKVEALAPAFGHRSGGTPILVTGKHFRNEPGLSCKFGEASVSAIFISPQKVSCIHPSHQGGAEDQVIFRLVSDSGEGTSWKYFEYINDPVVTSFHPMIGTSLGGADVVVRGAGFQSTIQLFCVFADTHVRAVLVNDSTVVCEIPRHPPGIVSFRVVDQYDRTLDTLTELSPQFEFVPEPSVEAVNINSNESTTRAVLLFARGSNFGNSNEMSCVYGDSVRMPATVLAESLLLCETPQEEHANLVNISITHLGSEYSPQSLLPLRLDNLSNAPNGTTMGHNVTLCEPGSFKPRSNLGVCLPCPVGYLCPLRGMSQPIICPEGHICSKLSLVSPSSPCVAGNYCLEGTKSSIPMAHSEVEAWDLDDESGVPMAAMNRGLWDYIPRIAPATGLRRFFHPPVDRKVEAGQPLPCPVSHYCRKGVKTPHHVKGDYTTPQICLEGHFCPRGSISPEGSGPCREGHYCPDNFMTLSSVVIPLAIPCDMGHYCPGTGNTYPKECFPGSYSPATGRSTCILCEVGRQCPEWGMSEPELCGAGFVCDIEGISTPTKLCPGGYVCEEGTSTEKPYIAQGVGPKPCPPGSACPSGTAHNVTGSWLPSFESGQIAPQPCAEGYHCPQNSSSIMGAGQCPPGHYCPPQSALPIKVPPGSFAGEEGGAIAPSLCLPGTFSPQPGSVSCTQCPAGYSCLTYGTYIPRICEPGTYRSKEDSLTCKPCPQRSFSPYSGLTDVSQCLPCPEGLVCSSKGMSDIKRSIKCPEGNACGYLTDGSSQYNHKCAAGQYCGEETATFNQYNKFCLTGTYCERGTTETLRSKNECNRGYFCSNGTSSPEPIASRCPRQTTTLLGSESMSMCFPESVAICDKIPHVGSNPFDRTSYYPLDESLEAAGLREMAVVHKVLPFNRQTSNVDFWKNDTVEVIRSCPSYMVQPGWTPKPSYGVRAEDTPNEWARESITILGRNFRNSPVLTCRYRTCLRTGWINDKGVEIVVPERCFMDSTRSHLSEAETRAGTFVSETRLSCPLPKNIVLDTLKPMNESNVGELFIQFLCSHDDDGQPFLLKKCSNVEVASGQCSRDDAVPELGLGRRIYSLVVACSDDEISRGLCANVPSPSLKLNPCFTSEVIVDVSNNGDKFSSDSTSIPHSLVDSDKNDSPEFELPPTYATYYVIHERVLDTFESNNNAINRKILISSFESDEENCNLISSHEEEHRPDSDGWFEAAYMNQFHLSFDWRLLPTHLVYGEHFQLAIHVVPSRCNEQKCSDPNRHIRYEENIPCLQPMQLPEWFTDASIDKNQFMNITLLALDDARFRVEIQLTHGLALPFTDFFARTMTVLREKPQRAKTDMSALRTLSPLISWEERSVEMPWIFGIRYDEAYSQSTSLPMNLPLRWKAFERGRVLIGMNTTYENTAPTIKDTNVDTEERRDFWSNPYQSEVIAKEQTDLYFETFHGLSLDQSTGSYDFDLHSLILPYLPYFSNCREFDSYIPLWALVESSTECKLPRVSSQYPDTWWRREIQPLPHQDDVEAIGPSDFMSFYPVADWCERKLHCSFEESLSSTDVTPRWFEADSGSILFSILRDPIDYYQYTGRNAATVGANDGGGQRFLDTITTFETFIPAKVSRSPAFNVEGDCAALCFPRRVTVDISYYQVDVHSKRIVQVNVVYDKFDKDTTNDEYELQFKFYPLNYQELVTKFAFTRGLFLMLFSYIGVGTVIVALIYWAVLRLTTSLENPPQLRISGYLWLTFPPALGGLLLGLIPITLVTAVSFYLVKGYTFDTTESDTDGRRWLFANTRLQYSDATIDPDLLHVTRQGRTGLAFFTMALASLYVTTQWFVPIKEPHTDQSNTKPITTSTWKRSNLLVSSILMSLFLVCIVEWSFWESFGTYIWEAIILMKFLGILIGQVMDNQLGEALLSAPVMTSFGLVQAVVTMSANDFMDFLLSYIVGFGFLLLERMYIGPLLSGVLNWSYNTISAMTQSVKKLVPPILLGDQNDSPDDTNSEAVLENEETLEPLLGSYTSYSCDVLSLLYFPFIMVVIMIFREEAEMMKLYNIKESDMEYYLLFALVIIPFQIMADIFMQNSLELLHGWKTYEYLQYCRVRFLQREMWWKGLETNTLDECIEASLRSVDQLCFSSQYYMLNTLHVNAIVYLVLGIVMMARAKYNAFGDPAMSSIIMVILLCSIAVKLVLTRIATFVGLWSIRHEKRRWHEKIQVNGEPQLEQWSNEQVTGHDEYKLEGRMTSDTFRYKFLRYNRSWLIEQLPDMLTPRMTQRSRPYLMNQLARILGSIDADISSDSEADDAPEFDVPAMNPSTREMIRKWYGEAGRFLRLSRLVEPIIQQAKDDVCEKCLGRGSLRVETCFSIEEMNRRFIIEYPECKDDIDQVLWKRFWQRNQAYSTICFPCVQRRTKEKYQQILDDDRSSDDAESIGDLITSELDNASSAILATWYSKARHTLR